jgi:ABC-type transport system involved in cytochrome c biogenesis permease subunit
MDQLTRYFPYGVVVVAGLTVMAMMAPPRDAEKGMHMAGAAAEPVMDGGRIKPLEGVARTTLMQISSRQTWRDLDDQERTPIEWLFAIVTGEKHDEAIKQAEAQPAFRISDENVIKRFGLKHDPEKPAGVFALKDLGRGEPIKQLLDEGKRLMDQPGDKLGPEEKVIKEIFAQVMVFADYAEMATPYKVFRIENDQVLDELMLPRRPGSYRYSYGEMLPRMAVLFREAGRADNVPEEKRTVREVKYLELAHNVQRYRALAALRGESLRIVPPENGDQGWRAVNEVKDGGPLMPLFESYAKGDVDGFNKALDEYHARLEKQMPGDVTHAAFEADFNHAEPFYQSTWLFFCVFLLACASWIGWSEPLRSAAFWLMVLTLVVHTAALFARMYLMNRPLVFITNLYSTAIFIGWVGALFGVGIEFVFRRGIGLAVGSLLGFLTSIIAHNLATGDTLEQVVAVLDTNFWLATHVTIINSGYAATFVAGLLGAGLILAGVLTPKLDRGLFRTLGQMLYGVLCFATLFSFVGTVLGGIWADQSWGRFWGWDPKENGALLIVLMNALILHARWAGLVQQRGMAVLAVLGNIIVLWSWFGVNMLNVGLHSYGFIPSTFWGMVSADIIHVGIAIVGMIPLRYWRSYAAMQAAGPRPPSPPSEAAPPVPPRRARSRRGRGASPAIKPA